MSEGAALPEAAGTHFRQRLHMEVTQKKTHAAVKQQLRTDMANADFASAGGPGSGGFLQYPEDGCCTMEDALWSVSLRHRVGMPHAEYTHQELQRLQATCCNRDASGIVCSRPLDELGYEAMTCQSGGGVLRRHSRLEQAVGGLIKRWTLQKPLFEQRVPTWDRRKQRRTGEHFWE